MFLHLQSNINLMLRKFYILSIFLLLLSGEKMFCQPSSAGNQVVGVLYSSDSTEVLSGIMITIDTLKTGAISDQEGKFLIDNVPQGEYELKITLPGYGVVKRKVHVPMDSMFVFYAPSISKDLPSVTITSGAYYQIKESVGSVYYTPTEKFKEFIFLEPVRTLQSFPGVNVQEEDGFGLYTNIGIRGTSLERSSKVTLLEDGVPVAPAPYSAPAAYYMPLLARMKGVEVIKGPDQYRYGPNTVGGTINFLSSPVPTEFIADLHSTGGSWNTKIVGAKIGNTWKNWSYLLEANNMITDGFKQLTINHTRQPTGMDRKDFLAKVKVRSIEKNKIYRSVTLKFGYTRDFSNESYLGLFREDFENNPFLRYPVTQYTQMDASHSHFAFFYNSMPSEKLEINATLYFNKFQRNWYDTEGFLIYSPDTSFVPVSEVYAGNYPSLSEILRGNGSVSQDTFLTYRRNQREYYSNGFRTDFKLSLNSSDPKLTHQLRWGGIFHFDGVSEFLSRDVYTFSEEVLSLQERGEKGHLTNRLEQTSAISFYLQYLFKYAGLTIIPVLRNENIDRSRKVFRVGDVRRDSKDAWATTRQLNKIFPGISWEYAWNEELNFFGSVYKGFSPPSISPRVRPEENVNYELGTKLFKSDYIIELVGFASKYKNLLGSDIDVVGGQGSWDLFNAGPAKAWGLEIFAIREYYLAKWKGLDFKAPVSLSYTYTEAYFLSSFTSPSIVWRNVEHGDQIPYIPRHQVSISLGLETQKFFISMRHYYQSLMWSRPGKGSMWRQEYVIPSYYTMDISFRMKITKKVNFTSSVTNVLNRKYVLSDLPSGLRPGRPRMFRAGVSVNW